MTGIANSNLRTAWRLFRLHWSTFLLAQLTVVAAWVFLEFAVISARQSGVSDLAYWPLWACLHLAFFWFFCGLMAGIHRMALQAVDSELPTFAAAFSCLDRGHIYLLTALLYWAAVIGGLALAVIPGVMAAVRWAPFRFVLVDGPHDGVSPLREAAELSASHRWQILRTLLVSVALNLGGAALLGIGLLVTFPLTLLLRAGQFRALQQRPLSVSGTVSIASRAGHKEATE